MQDIEKLFRSLADGDRLRILTLLLLEQDAACVCELVDALRLPQYHVSRQLAVLRDAGLVIGERRGTWVYYRIAPELPPLSRAVVDSLAAHPPGASAGEDRDRFASRLRLREKDVCAVGYPPDAPYREIIAVGEGRPMGNGL